MSRCLFVLLSVVATCAAFGFPDDDAQSAVEVSSVNNAEADLAPRTVEEARRQAGLLHEAYVATLLVVHREYFDEDERDTLPAKAFEDVFREIDERTQGHTRWIAVNTPAMNVDHEPKPGFEKAASFALTNGSKTVEHVGDGIYQRAAGIPFAASCSKCHQSALGNRRAGRMAGLVISLPVKK